MTDCRQRFNINNEHSYAITSICKQEVFDDFECTEETITNLEHKKDQICVKQEENDDLACTETYLEDNCESSVKQEGFEIIECKDDGKEDNNYKDAVEEPQIQEITPPNKRSVYPAVPINEKGIRTHKNFFLKVKLIKHARPNPDERCNESESLESYKRRKSAKYECEICGRGFDMKWRFKRHMLTHSGQKRFECKLCNMFFQIDNFNLHMKCHKLFSSDNK